MERGKVHSVKNKESLHFPFMPEVNLKTKLRNNVKKNSYSYIFNKCRLYLGSRTEKVCLHLLPPIAGGITENNTNARKKRNTKRHCPREGYVLGGMPHYTGKLFDLHKPASHPLLFIPELPCLGNNSSVQR